MKTLTKRALVGAAAAGLLVVGGASTANAAYVDSAQSGGCTAYEDVQYFNGFNHMRWVVYPPGGNVLCRTVLNKGGSVHYGPSYISSYDVGSWAGDAVGDNDQVCVQGINSVNGQPIDSYNCAGVR